MNDEDLALLEQKVTTLRAEGKYKERMICLSIPQWAVIHPHLRGWWTS